MNELHVECSLPRQIKGQIKVSGTIVCGFLIRTASGPECQLQAEPLGHSFRPRLATVGLTSVRAATHCSKSRWLSARLTRRSQSCGMTIGQLLNTAQASASPHSRRQRLDQRHSSARPHSPAHKAFRSTYRQTVHKCSSDSTRNDLNHP